MDPTHNLGNANQDASVPPAAPPQMPMPQAPAAVPPASAPANAADASWLPPTVPVNPPAQQTGSQPGQGAQTMVAVPAVADDGDLIEKEWVLKAKKIVEQTRQDPYKQTRELHKFRAEYMKKRYNKIIHPVEE